MTKPFIVRNLFFVLILSITLGLTTQLRADDVAPPPQEPANKKLVYLVSDISIPFWSIMSRGIKDAAKPLGYEVSIYSADNSAKHELELTIKALQEKVAGIIISPTTSSAAASILKFANDAHIPVVIADIGTDGGNYVSYISSDNKNGAYKIGKLLADRMSQRGWEKGSVGIVAIPQKRENGQARTAGFMKALNESGIKGAGIKQQRDFSYQETYQFAKEFIQQHAELHAIWLQGSDQYQAALDAIDDAGKNDEILLVCFDAEPIFLDLIPQGILVGAAMQQPFLMGQTAVIVMDKHLHGENTAKEIQLPVLAISAGNIDKQLPVIQRTVLGISSTQSK